MSVSMTSKVLCRYHMNGMCNKGEQCAFSHDFAAMPSQTCRYYLAGCCAYGDQCRFDHVSSQLVLRRCSICQCCLVS